MGASAQQIASAKALAKSRGYDPNLVDADNADRADSAFPVQAKPAAAQAKPAVATSVTPATASPAPAPAPTTGGGGAPASDGGGMSGLYSATGVTPPAGGDASAATGGVGAAGAAGATGGIDLSSLMQSGGMAPGTPGQLRTGLGLRQPPQDSMALAGLRRIY